MTNPTRSKSIDHVRLPIPSIIDPPRRRCVTIEIPDQYEHFAVFWGHFFGMTRWYTWKLDAAKSGKALAAVYQKIYDDARERFVLEEDSCMGCSPVNRAFSPALAPGETRKFGVVVEAGEFQLLPIVLKANQSITLSDWRGQWRDSQYHPTLPCSSNWETPEGFIIANAGGATADTFSTDALPTYPHMRLAMRVNNCGILTYHELSDPVTFTVPASVDPDGIFVEFFGNCPLDSAGEIAPGFLGYGMICLTAIVSDPNLCPQFFTDFTAPLSPALSIIQGIIVDPSPIGAGPALRAIQDGPSTMQSRIEIALGGCTVRDFAFTYYREELSPSFGSQCSWRCLDAVGGIIASGTQPLNDINTAANLTVSVGNVPNVYALNLRFHTNLIEFGPMLYIDDVFVN